MSPPTIPEHIYGFWFASTLVAFFVYIFVFLPFDPETRPRLFTQIMWVSGLYVAVSLATFMWPIVLGLLILAGLIAGVSWLGAWLKEKEG